MNLSTINTIERFENIVKQSPDQIQLEVKHYFLKGVYARELFIPKDVILTGHIHKYPQLNFLVQGEMEILVDDKIIVLKAPQVISSPAGVKRIARALEDSIWITVHPTDSKDINEIEQTFIAHSKQEFLEFINREPTLPFLECG